MSKSNISNGDTPTEVDVADNNNEWKVSSRHFHINFLRLIPYYLMLFC